MTPSPAGAPAGAVVPHAPVLLTPPVTPREPWASARESALAGEPEVVILVSPHGRCPGVYRTASGSLAGVGRPDVSVAAGTDEPIARAIAGASNIPLIDEPLDHGAVVPIAAGAIPDVPLVVCALPEVSGPSGTSLEEAFATADDLARTIADVARGTRLSIVASAHSSAALSERGPLGDAPEGHALHAAILGALSSDASELTRIPLELWSAGSACGAAVLRLVGAIFAGRRFDVVFDEAPFGVGYVVALSDGRNR